MVFLYKIRIVLVARKWKTEINQRFNAPATWGNTGQRSMGCAPPLGEIQDNVRARGCTPTTWGNTGHRSRGCAPPPGEIQDTVRGVAPHHVGKYRIPFEGLHPHYLPNVFHGEIMKTQVTISIVFSLYPNYPHQGPHDFNTDALFRVSVSAKLSILTWCWTNNI